MVTTLAACSNAGQPTLDRAGRHENRFQGAQTMTKRNSAGRLELGDPGTRAVMSAFAQRAPSCRLLELPSPHVVVIDDDLALLGELGSQLHAEGFFVTTMSRPPDFCTLQQIRPDILVFGLGEPPAPSMLQLILSLRTGLDDGTGELPAVCAVSPDLPDALLTRNRIYPLPRPHTTDDVIAAVIGELSLRRRHRRDATVPFDREHGGL